MTPLAQSGWIHRWLLAISVLSLAAAHAAEPPRLFNLQEIHPRHVRSWGTKLFLVFTGQPPHLLTFTNLAPSQLKRRHEPAANQLQVTYGKDFVGIARMPFTRPDPKAAVTSVVLTFETAEQAAAAAKALRPRDAIPSPLRNQKDFR